METVKIYKYLLIKYEDLEKNTNNTFENIINFTNKFIKSENHINTEKFNQAIKTTNFDILKKKEETEGFEEAVYSKKEGKIKSFLIWGIKIIIKVFSNQKHRKD